MLSQGIIKRIKEGPAILLLGQKYLSLTNNKDNLLNKTVSKFGSSSEVNNIDVDYNILHKINIGKDYEAVSSWIENLSKDMAVPLWLDRIATIPWSHVYTSAIDSIIARAFSSEWRSVQPVYDEKFKISDLRNKFNLHISYLFGCLSQVEQSKRAPFTFAEKISRRYISNEFLRRLPEIITPKGILVIDGYNENRDWLSIEDIYGVITQLGNDQVILFSASEEFKENDLIKEAITANKLLLFEESFAQFFSELEARGALQISIPEPDEYFGKWLTVGDQKIKIPQVLISRVSRTATIIDDSIFYKSTVENEDHLYFEFKSFLASTNILPRWDGFAKGFAFKRDFYQVLKDGVVERIQSNKNKETPLVLFGQSSSGKSISLGLLAYEIKEQFKIPVLFIEKRYQKTEEADIDAFCKWAEDNNAKHTLLIWDGMVEFDFYFKLLRRLNTRGRNIILVGSTYSTNKIPTNDQVFIEAPIELSPEEKKRFLDYIKNVDVILSNILSGVNDRNILAMLYRYLPLTREHIKKGLKAEFDFFSKLIRETSNEADLSVLSKGELYNAMFSAGIVENREIEILNRTNVVDTDTISISDQLIFSIMVPGQFALNVPFEILLRSIGYDTLSSKLFNSLNEVHLINWFEDSQGNIMLGPRTAIEAKILVNYLGSRKAQIEYIKLLLREIKANDITFLSYESNPEIQFAVELLNNIGPNSSKESYFNYLYEITEVLREVRENKQAYHPRLILKEASFLREIVKNKQIQIQESKYLLLERAESIVREALSDLEGLQDRIITLYLRVELSSILGTKAIEFSNDSNELEALECYFSVKELNNYAFASNPDNYSALDVLAWTTDQLIRKGVLTGIERIDAEAEMINLFEMAETEGISDQNKEDFYGRKLKFYDLIGNEQIATETFDHLNENGFTTGYYIRAKKILSDIEIGKITDQGLIVKKNKAVFEYLDANFESIKEDGKCLFLLLKSWWTMTTGVPLFSSEKQAIPFSKNDWEFCLKIVELLLYNDPIYQSATTLYLKAISEFHLGQLLASQETFRILDSETDFSAYGRKRIIKSYLASSDDGTPKVFSGEVKYSVSLKRREKSGEIFVSELKTNIPFILNDFNKLSFQSGEVISNFYIGFNFRGPIAVPVKL